MINAYFSSKYFHDLLFQKPHFIKNRPLLILFLIIIISNGFAASSETRRIQESDKNPTHYNFFRGRKRVLWCGNDPNVCMDPEKNPNFGSAKTCCFHKFCKDLMKDPNNCGSCGRVCAFGLVCCDGNCVDIRNNPLHCGACFEECLGENKCSYSMCDYGG